MVLTSTPSSEIIAIHKNIQTLDISDIIEIRGDKNAEYRSTGINGKSIRKKP